jgi:transposase
MKHYAGIDVSLEQSSVCVVDGDRRVFREAKVLSEPDALISWFSELGLQLERIGLEAGPLSQWLHAAMKNAGLAVELIETRHVRTAFKTMPVKTDRKDARGIAQLMRLGWFRPVWCKSLPAQEVRSVLTARKLVRGKLHDVEMCIRSVLRGFGLKVGPTTRKTFEPRIKELIEGHPSQRRRDKTKEGLTPEGPLQKPALLMRGLIRAQFELIWPGFGAVCEGLSAADRVVAARFAVGVSLGRRLRVRVVQSAAPLRR